MRIAYLTTMKRGLPTFVYRELAELTRLGAQVAVFTTKYARGLYMPQADWPVVRLRPALAALRLPLHWARAPLACARLAAQAVQTHSLIDFVVGCDYAPHLKALKIDRLHCVEGLHALAIGYYCHALTGLPLSVTIHADALYMAGDWPIIHTALHACDFVTTVCDFNRRKLIEDFHLPPERVRVVRLFVDADVLRPDQAVKVLIVGQFSQRKGHETLFKALAQLPQCTVRVWVVGEGTWGSVGDYVDVRQLARDLGVAERVTFFGSVSDDGLRALYQACDIFCLPSRKYVVNEGLPVSLMEAMACGKPVISTRHAGIPELVPDILIDENDATALAEALIYLTDHPEARQSMGERNRGIVRQHYSPANVRQLHSLYQT